MKMIDLLNKIANGEEVPMFKYEGHRYEYSKVNEMFEDLDNDERCKSEIYFCELNDEVEIIEEQEDKKIKRLNQDNFQCVSNLEASGQSANYFEYGLESEIRDIVDKINEIIDKVNELEKRYEKQDK